MRRMSFVLMVAAALGSSAWGQTGCPDWSPRLDQLIQTAPTQALADSMRQTKQSGLQAAIQQAGGAQKALELTRAQSAEDARVIAELQQTIRSGAYMQEHVDALKATQWAKDANDEVARLFACFAGQSGETGIADASGGQNPQAQLQKTLSDNMKQSTQKVVDSRQKQIDSMSAAGVEYQNTAGAAYEQTSADLNKAQSAPTLSTSGKDLFNSTTPSQGKNLSLTTNRPTLRPAAGSGGSSNQQDTTTPSATRGNDSPSPGGQLPAADKPSASTVSASANTAVGAGTGGGSASVSSSNGATPAQLPAGAATPAAASAGGCQPTARYIGPALSTDRLRGVAQHLLMIEESFTSNSSRDITIEFAWTLIESGTARDLKIDRVVAKIPSGGERGIAVVGFAPDSPSSSLPAGIDIRRVSCVVK
jgi:hypothetical protein